MSKWVEEELEDIDLGDGRLNERSRRIVSQFYGKPGSSINGSFSGWNETKAAYRFFDNNSVNVNKILLPHRQKTEGRIKETNVVLCMQDTTIIDYSHRQEAVDGLGKLRSAKHQGFLLHPTISYDGNGVCLGVVNYKTWTRQELQGKKARQIVKPVEEKESMRWIESYRITDEIARKYPDKLFINIADREGDFYELLQEYDGTNSKAHIIVRAKSNRVINCEGDGLVKKLRDKLELQPVIGEVKFMMSEISDKRQSREVRQTLRSCQILLSPPKKRKKMNDLKPISISAVLCREENPPDGEEGVEWLLLTSLELQSERDKILEVIKYYQLRWQIELYFKVLKSGCNIEKLQLENIKRLENCLALYMIVAWRILFLTYVGKFCPHLSCELFYENVEWQAVYIIAHKTNPPEKPPSIESMNRMVASLGGFLNRTRDADPGIKSMWTGLRRLKDFSLAFELFTSLKTYG